MHDPVQSDLVYLPAFPIYHLNLSTAVFMFSEARLTFPHSPRGNVKVFNTICTHPSENSRKEARKLQVISVNELKSCIYIIYIIMYIHKCSCNCNHIK